MQDSPNNQTLHITEHAVLSVKLQGKTVGLLAKSKEGSLAFEYTDEWLFNGFSISPFSLPLEKRVFVAKPHPLDGVFGVFADSLPDGWGRLLVDRTLARHRINPAEIDNISRLSLVGTSGMGALEYEPATQLFNETTQFDLDEIAQECAAVLKDQSPHDLDTLFELGGSSGGARPKVFVTIDNEPWIVKFPSSIDSPYIGAEEFEISQMATRCGINMAETKLFESSRTPGYFGTKRFDRMTSGSEMPKKIHMISAAGLLETSHRVPNLDYADLMRLTWALTDNAGDIEALYRLMCFNAQIGNRDDHSKNFSFLYNTETGSWHLSPAYDLTRNSGFNGEHSTTVNGKGKNIELADMVTVGTDAGMIPRVAKEIAEDIASIVKEELATLPSRTRI